MADTKEPEISGKAGPTVDLTVADEGVPDSTQTDSSEGSHAGASKALEAGNDGAESAVGCLCMCGVWCVYGVCTRAYLHLHPNSRMDTHACVYTYMFARDTMCMWVYVRTLVCTYTHAYTRMHARIRAYVHACMHACLHACMHRT